MKNSPPAREKMLLMSGILFVLSGVLLNEWVLAALFSKDGIIAASHKLIIWTTDSVFVIVGLVLIVLRKYLKEWRLLVFAGCLVITAGFILNDWYLSFLLPLNYGSRMRLAVRFFDVFLIVTGLIAMLNAFNSGGIFLRHRKKILLAGILILMLLYDFYLSSLSIIFIGDRPRGHSQSYNIADDHLGWRPRPSSIVRHTLEGEGNFDVTYEIDENGFKKVNNDEHPDFSIYFLGDSLTFGIGVDNKDTFSNIIKDKYLTKGVNVYNAGVSAYGIVQMFQYFVLNIEGRIRPNDMVILTPLTEDFMRNIKNFYFPYFLVFTSIEEAITFPYFDNGVIRYARIEKNLFNFIKLSVLNASLTGKKWRDLYNYFAPDTIEESVKMIEAMKKKTESRGGKFYLIFLPQPRECRRGNYDFDTARFNYFDIMKYFPSDVKRLNGLVFKDDGHWNVKGHEIAARAIIETLADEKIIDRKYLKE